MYWPCWKSGSVLKMSNKLNMSIQTGRTSSVEPQSREYQENEGFSSAVSDKLNTQHFNSHFPGARPDVSSQTALRINKQRKVHYLIRVDWSVWEATVHCELFSRGWRCIGLLYWCWNDPPAVPFTPVPNYQRDAQFNYTAKQARFASSAGG